MVAPTLTITSLTAVPTLRGNKLAAFVVAAGAAAFGGLPYLQLDVVEFYSSTTNDFATATKVGEGNPEFLHAGLIEEATYYYWAIPRNTSGDLGSKYPVSSTAGVSCAAAGRANLVNGKLVWSVSGNALTVEVKTLDGQTPSASNPVFVTFDAVLGYGTFPRVVYTINSATSVTFPATVNTFNTVANIAFGLWACVVLKSGALYLGIMNCISNTSGLLRLQPLPQGFVYGNGLVENMNGTSAPTGGVLYLNTAALPTNQVTECQVSILGNAVWASGLATPGSWSAGPDRDRLFAPGMPKPGDEVNRYRDTRIQASSALFNDAGTAGAKKPLPLDDTIPANDEGYSVVSVALNTQSPANVFDTEWSVTVAPDAANEYVALMIMPAGSPASAVDIQRSQGADLAFQMTVREMALALAVNPGYSREFRIGYSRTGAVSPANFKVYYGRLAAGRLFGGTWNHHLTVRELQG